MKTNDNRQAALAAIASLRYAAARGDIEAAAALAEVGCAAARNLDSLACRPADSPGRVAVDTAAAGCDRWPVAIPAIEELRQPAPALPATLGKSLPIRARGGATKKRNFSYDSPAGFALVAFEDLDKERMAAPPDYVESLKTNWHLLTASQKEDWHRLAATLPPLDRTAAVIAKWTAAGVRWAEDCCGGQWKTFPWPWEVLNRAEQRTNSRKRGIETVVREKLKAGFAAIAAPATY